MEVGSSHGGWVTRPKGRGQVLRSFPRKAQRARITLPSGGFSSWIQGAISPLISALKCANISARMTLWPPRNLGTFLKRNQCANSSTLDLRRRGPRGTAALVRFVPSPADNNPPETEWLESSSGQTAPGGARSRGVRALAATDPRADKGTVIQLAPSPRQQKAQRARITALISRQESANLS